MGSKPSRNRSILLITPGDPGGIGPEITAKALQGFRPKGERPLFLCVGAPDPFQDLGVRFHTIEAPPATQEELTALLKQQEREKRLVILSPPQRAGRRKRADSEAGFQAGWSIKEAVSLIQRGLADALVTGPIHKGRLQAGGYPYSGHTDFLADLCGVDEVTMMLANSQLRSSLVTVHQALSTVSGSLTGRSVERAVLQTIEGLRNYWGISRPRVAVAGLNPHCGEGGLFGHEEDRIIRPAIARIRRRLGKRAEVIGPLPADTLFAQHIRGQGGGPFDAVVSQYHDQGLIPVKLLDFGRTVNLTLGLPLIRTSVDHGTAFDIAGKNRADASSLLAAIELALHFVEIRKKRLRSSA
jgi:4-hydroxythreonine-4-phosphate dehydrogenase